MKLYRVVYWLGSMITECYTVAESEEEIRGKSTKRIVNIEFVKEV